MSDTTNIRPLTEAERLSLLNTATIAVAIHEATMKGTAAKSFEERLVAKFATLRRMYLLGEFNP